MFKYLICTIIGILLYILFNHRNGFSIGVPVMDLNVIFPDEEYPDKITDDIIDPFGEGIPREFYEQGLRLGPRSSRSSISSKSELEQRLLFLLSIAENEELAGAHELEWLRRFMNDDTRRPEHQEHWRPTWLEEEVRTWEWLLIDTGLIHSSSNLSFKLYDVGWYYANDTGRIFISAITSPRKVPIAKYIDYNMYKYKKELIINGKKYYIGTPGKEVKDEYRLDNQDNALFIIDLDDNNVVDGPLDKLSPPPDM